MVLVRLHLAGGDPTGATETLAPCLDGSAPGGFLLVPARAWLLDALASDALGDHDQEGEVLEQPWAWPSAEASRVASSTPAPRSLLARYRERVPTSWSYLDELLRACRPRPWPSSRRG